jgi:hypothetical protein
MDWSVGEVEQVFDRGAAPLGWGFEIIDRQHRPLLMFSYATEIEAVIARRLILIALERAQSVSTPDRPPANQPET